MTEKKQQSLEAFEVEINDNYKWHRVKSAGGDGYYMACAYPPKCRHEDKKEPCEHYRYKDPLCTHVKEARIREQAERISYLEERSPADYDPFFTGVDMFMAYYEAKYKKSYEKAYVETLILELCFAKGKTHSNEIYLMVEGQFMKSPCSLGGAFLSLKNKGFIKKTGTFGMRIRPQGGHRTVQPEWELTEKGYEVFREHVSEQILTDIKALYADKNRC